jgi:predicted NBD/HSP70 family sugar kinase
MVAVLQSLFTGGPQSRAGLARSLGLNRSSSGQVVAELTTSGLVREVPDEKLRTGDDAKAGRPGIMLALAPQAATFTGIEIGVEHISFVRINLSGAVEACRTEEFDAASSPVEEAVRLAARFAFADVQQDRLSLCKGVGFSVPAHIAPDGTVKLAPLMGWRNVDVAAIARSALSVDVPIIVENDANALAFGDGYVRGRSGVTLFLSLESGVGGGILIDGKLFRGDHGLAGEIGHTRATEDGAELEQLIGREKLLQDYRHAAQRPACRFSDFLADVRDRDPAAVTVAENWARNLAFALANACRLIDPQRIVLGGACAALYPLVSARVTAHMAGGKILSFPLPEISIARAPELGSAFGAACLLHQRYLSLANEEFMAGDGHAETAVKNAGSRHANNESILS